MAGRKKVRPMQDGSGMNMDFEEEDEIEARFNRRREQLDEIQKEYNLDPTCMANGVAFLLLVATTPQDVWDMVISCIAREQERQNVREQRSSSN